MDRVVKHSLKNTAGTSITAFFNNLQSQKSKTWRDRYFGPLSVKLWQNKQTNKKAKWIEIYQLQSAEENLFPKTVC